jgi:outer membrane lipoprotein-sorting protein
VLTVLIVLFFLDSPVFALSTRDLIESFNKVSSYSTLLKSEGENGDTIIRYFYKKPGLKKMVFIKPHKGAVLVYNPKTHKVKLRPFRYLGFTISLKPESSLIKDPKGHTVDRSDLGALLKNVLILSENGTEEIRNKALFNNNLCSVLSVKGKKGFEFEGITQYLLWIDTKINLPVRIESYGNQSNLLEKVLLEDLEVNVELPDEFFR